MVSTGIILASSIDLHLSDFKFNGQQLIVSYSATVQSIASCLDKHATSIIMKVYRELSRAWDDEIVITREGPLGLLWKFMMANLWLDI